MWEGPTSKVMAADRPDGEFYDFYSISPENFVYHLIYVQLPCIMKLLTFELHIYITLWLFNLHLLFC